MLCICVYIYIILDDLHLFHTLLPFQRPLRTSRCDGARASRSGWRPFAAGCRWSDARRPRHNCWWRRWALDRDFGWKTWWKTGESPRKMGTSRRIFWELDWGKCPKIADFFQVGERLIIIHPDVFAFRVPKTVSKVRMFIDGGLIESLTEWVIFLANGWGSLRVDLRKRYEGVAMRWVRFLIQGTTFHTYTLR